MYFCKFTQVFFNLNNCSNNDGVNKRQEPEPLNKNILVNHNTHFCRRARQRLYINKEIKPS